jgi:hypothetical protein
MGLFATSAWADFKQERTLKLEPGGTFTLESDIGDVVLTGESASGARVLVTSDKDLDRDFDVSFDETARGVTVRIKQRGALRRFFSGWFENDHTRITIQVPTKTDVRLSTSGGSVRVSRLTGVVDMHSSGGSLDVGRHRRQCQRRYQRWQHPDAGRARQCRREYLGRQHHHHGRSRQPESGYQRWRDHHCRMSAASSARPRAAAAWT